MKKQLLWLTVALLAMAAVACRNDEVTVYPEPDERPHEPITKTFYIVDQEGNDLIRGGWVRTSDVYALYRGQKYPCNKDFNTQFNDNVTLHGLAISNIKGESGRYALTFGDIDCASDYNNETITLCWSDGSTDKLIFTQKLTWDRLTGRYNETHLWTFNGEANPEECVMVKQYLCQRERPDGYMVPMEWILNDEALEGDVITVGAQGGTNLLVCDNYPTFDSISIAPEADWISFSQINNKIVLNIEPYTDGDNSKRTVLLIARYMEYEGMLTISQSK